MLLVIILYDLLLILTILRADNIVQERDNFTVQAQFATVECELVRIRRNLQTREAKVESNKHFNVNFFPLV